MCPGPEIRTRGRHEGWRVNHKRVKRIWRREGLKIPRRQPKRGWLWLNDGSCVRRRPERRNHVCAYDFCVERTRDGRPVRMLVVVDEFTRECLSIDVARKLTSEDVLDRLTELFARLGVPGHIRSDNVLTAVSMAVLGQQVPLASNEAFLLWSSPSGFHRLWASLLTIVTQDPSVSAVVFTVLKTKYAPKWKVRALSTRSNSPLWPS